MLDAEYLADRRRMRRKLGLWRVLGILGAIVGVLALGAALGGRAPGMGRAGGDQIARISVDGFIAGDTRMADLMKRAGESAAVKGVVISVNSPGGTTTGAEELYRNIRRLAEKKPLVAFVDGTAASGGYITALGADHIVARETSLIGSIGVLIQYPNVQGLLERIGVAVEDVKSSPLKAEPSGYKPTSPEARAALEAVVMDTFGWFKSLVGERRRLAEGELATVSTGQVFNGRQALPLKLVDQLGGEAEAVAYLVEKRGVAKDLPVRNWRPRGSGGGLDLWTAAAWTAELAGLEGLGRHLRGFAGSLRAASLDGLLALWQPPR